MNIEQLRELIERLQADAASVTNEELTQAREFIREQRGHLAGQDPSDDVISALEELRDARNAITVVSDERAAAAAELEGKRQGLLSELDDPSGDTDTSGDGGSEDAGAGAADGAPTDPAPDPAGDPAPGGDAPAPAPAPAVTDGGAPVTDEAPVPVAASAGKPRRAPIGAFRTPAPAVTTKPRALTVTGRVTAAGGSPGFVQGQQITSTAELAQAMTDRLRSMASGRSVGGGEKVYVANVTHEYPEERTLRQKDWVGNFSKIEAATSRKALTAAGGLCAPLETLYDVEVIGSTARPIRDALARYGVDRGGIQFRPNSSAATALIGGTGTGVDTWTMDQDADATNAGDVKGCYVVDCPAIEDAEVQAIYLCLEFANITARFDPETTAAHIREGAIAHARKAENELLRQLQAGSKVLAGPQNVGASRDVLVNIDKACAYYRNRHRLDTSLSLTSIMPAWVLYLMRTDLARQMAAGDWMSALNVSDAMIESWFRERGVNPVWHLDGQIGGTNEVQTVTVTGTPTGGSYTLTFDGQTTDAIAYNTTAADVRAALEELSNINVGSVTVAGGPHPGTAITVAFGGDYEGTNVPQMTADDSGLTGGTTPAVTVTTTTASSSTGTVNGVSIPSQVYADAAAGSNIPAYPTKIDALLFTTGTKLFLDGGTLDLGLVRDSSLNSRNRYRQFMETFEGVADRGVENLRLVMAVDPNGSTVGTIAPADISD